MATVKWVGEPSVRGPRCEEETLAPASIKSGCGANSFARSVSTTSTVKGAAD